MQPKSFCGAGENDETKDTIADYDRALSEQRYRSLSAPPSLFAATPYSARPWPLIRLTMTRGDVIESYLIILDLYGLDVQKAQPHALHCTAAAGAARCRFGGHYLQVQV